MEEMKRTGETDRAMMSLEQPETSSIVMTKPVKIEEDDELKTSLCCTSEPDGAIKSKQHLTEAEKEARRLRRILANRESARQTIRRRQAMFEELTRKAVDLGLANDTLKKDKELAVQEYESLKSTNECLKAQIEEMIKAEAEIEEKSKSERSTCVTSVSTTTTNFPCNLASIVPFQWPMTYQPSDVPIDQLKMESGISTPLLPMTQLWSPDSFLGQGSNVMIANPGTLLCVPFPCFFPFHAPGSAGHSQPSEVSEKEDGTSAIHHPYGNVSSVQMLNNESSSSKQVLNSAGSASTEDHDQPGFSFWPDGGGEGEGICQQRMIVMPAPLNCVRPVASIRPFTALHQEDSPNIVRIPSTGKLTAESLLRENQEEIAPHRKNATDAIAAAEARRRRKELIKLKNIHTH